jgi:hypothetical protein
MQKGGRRIPSRRVRWLGVLVLTALIAAAVILFPRGLRGPETVAIEFLEALLQTPDDPERLRAAAHLADGDDPQRLLGELTTRITLEFLHARERQGMQHRIGVSERHRPTPQSYAMVLKVTEQDDNEQLHTRRFHVGLQQAENGDWRVSAVRVAE